MREKIAKVYMTPIEDWATGQYTVEKVAYMCADQILTLIREEIEKVENPYDAEGALSWMWHTAFRETKRAILKALEAE